MNLPSLKGIYEYFQGEVGYAVIIGLIIFCGISAFKRDTSRAIVSLIACGMFYVFVQNPEGTIIAWMEGLTNLLSGR
ncbi:MULTISPECIES: TcpD family membrane protein [unclassified Enterococcus]|nr:MULTISPECIES: TcpD family membrane protein [unclassified Enterococcus]MBK0036048.1 hypothetical protein [Enterococcus sp. S52]MBK0068706.1 hypothetical protein [Enterococcus sp. S53]MBK0139299.1 hypothetical protein [Enterococcus sp. S76]MBK0142934.1 hypothetical protein [Enterococcus sp. S77]